MKRFCLIALWLLAVFCVVAVAAPEFTFYYMIESPPRSLPGVDPSHDGVMILVRVSADSPFSACVDYALTETGEARQACSSEQAHPDPDSTYQPIRLDFGIPAEAFRVTQVSVTVGEAMKSVPDAVPGTEY